MIVVDDGSSDDTRKYAVELGVTVIGKHRHLGLGVAMKQGIRAALSENADIIVTLDADGQHNPRDILRLIKPIINGRADYVIGARQYQTLGGSIVKRLGNVFFSSFISFLTGISISDTQSGFRAMNREVAESLQFRSFYSYTQESVIQVAESGFDIFEVSIEAKKRRIGGSRLIGSILGYTIHAFIIIMRTFRDFHPLFFFSIAGGIPLLVSLLLFLYLLVLLVRRGWGYVGASNTLLIAVFLLIFGIQIVLFGFLADMMRRQRNHT